MVPYPRPFIHLLLSIKPEPILIPVRIANIYQYRFLAQLWALYTKLFDLYIKGSAQYRPYPVFPRAYADAYLAYFVKGGAAQCHPLAAVVLLQFQGAAAAVKCIGLQVHILLLIWQHIHLKIYTRRFPGSYLQTTAGTHRHTTIVTVRRPYP